MKTKFKALLCASLLCASTMASAQRYITLGPGQQQVPMISFAEYQKLLQAEQIDHHFFASGAAGHMGEGTVSVAGQVAILVTIGTVLYAMWQAENNPPPPPKIVYVTEVPCYSQTTMEIVEPNGRRYMERVCQ